MGKLIKIHHPPDYQIPILGRGGGGKLRACEIGSFKAWQRMRDLSIIREHKTPEAVNVGAKYWN